MYMRKIQSYAVSSCAYFCKCKEVESAFHTALSNRASTSKQVVLASHELAYDAGIDADSSLQ